MTKQSHKDELIHKFLREELNDEELVSFKQLWETDPDFVEEVQQYAQMTTALRAADRLSQEKQRDVGIKTKVRKLFIEHRAVAAVLLLAVMLPFYLLFQGQKRAITPESPEIRDYAQELFITDRLNNKSNVELTEILDNYENGDLVLAISIAKKMDNQSPEFAFLIADLYFKLALTDSAQYFYQQGLNKDPSNNHARWNLLMAQMLSGELIQVKKQLTDLSYENGSPLQLKAQKLLDKLE